MATKKVDLFQRYRDQIQSADWAKIRQNAEDNPQWSDDGSIVGLDLLGSILSLFPSGKIWTLWTSNQTIFDMVRDTVYREVLESVADEHGMFIEEFSGDIFAGIFLDDGYDAIIWHDRNSRHGFPHSGFYQNGNLIARTGFELEQYLNLEGEYPNIYRDSHYSELSYLTDWESEDGYDQDGDDYPIEDNPVMVAYVEAMLWSSTDSDDIPLDQNYDIRDLDNDARAKVYRDCSDFLQNPIVQRALESKEWTAEQLGHDFWLTRNRHGAGFWDRGKGDLGTQLTALAQPYGEQNPYVYTRKHAETWIGLDC